MMNANEVIHELKRLSTPEHFNSFARFGIPDKNALGVKMPDIRKLAKKIGKNHILAMELWHSEVHEAKALAPMIADEKLITENDFDWIVSTFDSWDLCDGACKILSKTPFAKNKITEYADNQHEFVKRTAFVLMCSFAVHHKEKPDEFFYPFFQIIEREARDNRNFVRKAVNWALRQIGKRNGHLKIKAIETAERIKEQDSKSARWIANDALRELRLREQ